MRSLLLTAFLFLGIAPALADDAWLDQLAADFVASNWNWPGLVKDIVLSDAYRSVQ